jgi:type VI secretion system secreted protein VgrG
MSTRTVDIELTLGVEERYRVVACRVVEGISRLTHAELEIASLEDIDLDGSLTGDATLVVALDGAPSRKWTLKVGRAGFVGIKDGTLRYRVELHAHLWLLRHTLSTRKFRNMSAKEIISKVLSECGVPFEWRATRATPTRKYCVQYRETNLAFVSRLLEFEGIYYTLDPEGVLVLEDVSTAAGTVEGKSRYELLDSAGALDRDELGVHEIRSRARVAPGKATVNDFTWKKPRLNLLTSKSADLDTELETYEYPLGYRNPKDGAYLAQIRLEAQRVPSKTVEGKGTMPTFAPARKFTFGDAAGGMFAGEYVIIEVEHVAHNAVYPDVLTLPGGTIYENRFSAIPSRVPFRPAWETPRPTIAGVHTAMVRGPGGEEIHTDKYGRFRAQFHWDREAKGTDEDSRWVRQLQESATSMVLARVGWEMSVAYIDGDPDRPVGIARNINGVMVPAYSQPGSKNVMTIKTPTSPATGGFNEIRLDDSAGTMSFYVRAERDLVGIIKHDKTERIGNNETHSVGFMMNRGIENNQFVNVGANSTTSCDNDYRLVVKKDRTIEVGGNETIEVGVSASTSIFTNDTETVGAVRLTQAGLKTPGSINRRTEANLTRTVGGSFIAVGLDNIQTLIKKNYVETVGGIKLTKTQKGVISQVVGGQKNLTVGGSVIRKSAKDMGIGAEVIKINVGAIATLSSRERVEIKGKEVFLEAQSSLTLSAPGLELSLKPGVTSMKGTVHLESGDKVTVTGAPDNITS